MLIIPKAKTFIFNYYLFDSHSNVLYFEIICEIFEFVYITVDETQFYVFTY